MSFYAVHHLFIYLLVSLILKVSLSHSLFVPFVFISSLSFQKMRSPHLLRWLLAPLLPLAVLGELVVHDADFVPDHVIRVTAEDISQACDIRHSTVINGTSPGPPIVLQAGKSAWIRVYNDVPDHNLTMVSLVFLISHFHGNSSSFLSSNLL